jgi:hypothetical protein
MNTDVIPAELRTRDQWVTWRYEKEGKPVSKDTEGATKIPYNPRTGHKASSTNANTWTPYTVAVRAAQTRQHSGVGFVFSEADPFTGIDLDHCIDPDGSLQPWAMDIVSTMDSYTEISPSGSGVKIWVVGKIPSSVKTPQIEMYFSARYFTVTGQHYDNTPTTIRDVNGALTQLYEAVKKEAPAPSPALTPRATIGDEHATAWARKKLADAIRMVTQAADGMKDDTLIDAGRLAGGVVPYVSESEIETALYAAIAGRAADKSHALHTIRNGIRMGMQAPLPVPPPPPQPVFDAENYACCPVHQTRLDPAKNGNGYKCRQRDATTASGWCDFWWKGEGYIAPKETEPEQIVIAGEVIQTSAKAPLGFQLYRIDDLRGIPPVSWLIPNELPAGLLSVLCGPSEAGKSFLSVHYAMSVALANPDRLVVYVAAEGGGGYLNRCEAWLLEYGGAQPQNLVFILRSVPILDSVTLARFITTIRHFNPVLVILDTMARCLVGGDENSAKDVGVFIEGCDEIRRQTHAAVMVVHHTGKSGNYRGSSALFGGCDNWIDFANDDGLITVSCGKAKDWKKFEPRYLRMVERGASVVLLPAEQVTQRGAQLTEGQRKVLETLALDVFQGPGAKAAQIMSSTGIPEKTLFRILSRLKRDGMIGQGNRGDPYTITQNGLTEIKSYHRALRESRETEQTTEQRHPNASLSLLSPTVTTDNDTTVTSVTPPYIYRGVTVQGGVTEGAPVMGSGWREVDLFPEDDTTSESIKPDTQRTSDLVARLKNKGARVIEGAELRQALADSADTTFSTFTGSPVEGDDDATEGQEPTDER